MAICQLMILDFMEGWGRYCEDTGDEQYSNYDLEVGLDYVQALMEEGYTREPFHGYRLDQFEEWAQRQLNN